MINFNYETNFLLKEQVKVVDWLHDCILSYGFDVGEINYIFCDDNYLHKLNVEFLNHDTYTDIISFDYTLGKKVGGDVFISVERVQENAVKFSQRVDNELYRVMIHGLLHFMGYKDKSSEEKERMRREEEVCLKKIKF